MDAARNEVDQPPTVQVEWKGDSYAIPASLDDAPIDVMEAIEDGKAYRAAKWILGPDQWDQMKAKHKPTKGDVDGLMDEISKALGFESSGK